MRTDVKKQKSVVNDRQAKNSKNSGSNSMGTIKIVISRLLGEGGEEEKSSAEVNKNILHKYSTPPKIVGVKCDEIFSYRVFFISNKNNSQIFL